MTEELISFETAKLAKEKGFKNKSSNYYNGASELITSKHFHSNNIMQMLRYEAPTQSFLQKWLREEHNCYIEILMNKKTKFQYRLISIQDNKPHGDIMGQKYYNIYEQCLEKALQIALKLIE